MNGGRNEPNARDAAQILAEALGLNGYSVVADLRENDRSATGFLDEKEFEATVDAFFAQPETSVRGWEPAVDAQARAIGSSPRLGRSGASIARRDGVEG